MPQANCLVWSITVATLISCRAAVAADALPSVFAEDLRHTPPNAYVVAVMRPAKMSQLDGVQDVPGADFAGANPVKPSEVERVVATVYPAAAVHPEARHQTLGFGVVLQLRNQLPRERIVAWLSPEAQVFPGDDRVYMHPEWNSNSMVLGFVDDHTILAGHRPDFVFDRLSQADAEESARHALAPAFADVDPTADAVVVADMARLTHYFHMMSPEVGAPLIKQIEPLQLARWATAAVNLTAPDGFVFHVQNDSAADGEQLGRLAQAMLFSKTAGSIATLREMLGEDFAEQIQSVEQRVSAILEDTSLQSNATSSTIRSRQLPSAAEVLKLVADVGALHAARLRRSAADLEFKRHMQQVGLGFHYYHDTYNKLPRDIAGEDGTPLLSWRVALLPYVGESDLYSQFHLDEPWDSEHNVKLMEPMPRVYGSRVKGEPMKTSIQWVTGAGTGGAAASFDEIRGLSQVLALIESDESVEWTRPIDFVFDSKNPANNLRPAGSFGMLYDGSPVYLSPETDAALLRSAFLNDGGEFDAEQLRYAKVSNARASRPPDPVRPDEEQFAKLTAALNSENQSEIADALQTLGRPQPKSPDPRAQAVVDKAVELLDSQSPLIRGYALRVIREWGRHVNIRWRPIAVMLDDPYEANRWLAIDILKDFPEAELVQAMLRLPSADRAVTNLVFYNDYAGIAADAAVPLLEDAEFRVRLRACHVIAGTGDDSHIPKLKRLLDDKHPAVREAAGAAIEHLDQQAPLAAAMEEFDGDVTAALKKVAQHVRTDDDGNPIAVDLTQFDTPYRLVRNDYPVLGKVSSLKSLKLTYSDLKGSDVTHLKELPLEELEINYCPRLDDAVADPLRGMTMLRSLRIDETNVGDRTASAIAQLPNLEELGIADTRITDKGLSELGKLRKLRSLNLSRTRITDTGLAALAGHTELRELFLLENGITDAAIPHLETLKGLQFMNLSGCELSSEALARLRAALPNCRGLEIR